MIELLRGCEKAAPYLAIRRKEAVQSIYADPAHIRIIKCLLFEKIYCIILDAVARKMVRCHVYR